MLGDWSYSIATQNTKQRTWRLGTGRHTIIYVPNRAWGLVQWNLHHARGLYRPPSTIRSGTVPTTERYMLGDWSINLFNCSQTGKFNFLDLATRLILRLPASSGTTSVRCIWRCISVTEFL
jgi:hypothetical protein